METRFVFRGVIRVQKIYSENVSKLILGRCNEENAHTSIIDVEGVIEVHHLVLRASSGDGLLDLSPLSDETSERL